MKRRTAIFLPVFLFGCAHPSVKSPEQCKTGVPAKPVAASDSHKPAGGGSDAPHAIKPYASVIGKDAKTQRGLFLVHRINDKLYYEIPKAELGKEFLWSGRIARTILGIAFGGKPIEEHVVRWERHGNRILLRSVSYEIVADATLPIARAVAAANNDTIIMSFPIEALGKGDAPVIEVSKLFVKEVPEFSAKTVLHARGFDTDRSFLERVTSFPTNIEVEASQTYTVPVEPNSTMPVHAGEGMRPGSATVLMHYSMVKLPERPMVPRLHDDRIGYFSIRQYDYGREDQRAPRRRYIKRWRLEKQDPAAALSLPVTPIVYWIDPATPKKWVPYLKRAVESWQVAFEAAGFKNAILAREAPSPKEDPTWSPEDARYSVIRWLASTVQNARGPSVVDPRTGEILQADIEFYHNVMRLARNWYFTQVGPLDPRAKKLPLPDDLMGSLIEYVMVHEVGHTLGLEHNMKASSTYPADKLRDREWIKKMGHTPSIMDYSRFNYVAQPEDGIDAADLIPRIGPYDAFAIGWGYRPILGMRTPDEEKATLNDWLLEQDRTPWLRFSTAIYLRMPPYSEDIDPGDLAEAVGDADAVKSTGLGLKNLERVMDMLLPAVSQPGESFEELAELYTSVQGQLLRELEHVVAIVGGFDTAPKHIGQEGPRFTPVSRERQAAAVRFLNERAFTTPEFLIRPDILARLGPVSDLDVVRRLQVNVLNQLLEHTRLARLLTQDALGAQAAYHPADFLTDVRQGIFRELNQGQVRIDPFRRNLQRAYLEILGRRVNETSTAHDDTRALFRGELLALGRDIARCLPKVTDSMTRLHLEDLRDRIPKALDPKFAPQVASSPSQPSNRAPTKACFLSLEQTGLGPQ